MILKFDDTRLKSGFAKKCNNLTPFASVNRVE